MINPTISADWSTNKPIAAFSCTPGVQEVQTKVEVVHLTPGALTCIDRFTHWPKAFPLNNITADSVAHAFMSGWISQFGTPSTITTDRGSQFESSLWHSLMHLLGSSRLRTTANYSKLQEKAGKV